MNCIVLLLLYMYIVYYSTLNLLDIFNFKQLLVLHVGPNVISRVHI